MNLSRPLLPLSAIAATLLLSAGLARADDVPPTPAANAPLPAPATPAAMTATANVNLVSDYRFRGIDQTWGHPAVQGGVDLAWPAGLYAGAWASNVSGNSYPGGSLEFDYYGGYNGKINDDFGYTAGLYGYVYPGANVDKSACPSAAYPAPCSLPAKSLDTLELNAGVNWKWISYKLSVSAGDYFGANAATGYSKGTRGTLYHDVSVTWPIADDLSLVAHVGHTDIKARYGNLDPDYTDYRVTLSKTFAAGWNISGAWAGANNDRFYRPPSGGLSYANEQVRAVNRGTAIFQLGRSF